MRLSTCLLASAAALLLTGGVAAAATVVADADLNVRSGPGVQYPVVAVIPDGAPVDATACQGGWCHVDYRGRVGWASSTYLTGAVAAAPYAYSYAYTEPYYAEPYNYEYYGPFGFGLGPAFAYGGGFYGYHHFHHFGHHPFPHVGMNHFHFHHFGNHAFPHVGMNHFHFNHAAIGHAPAAGTHMGAVHMAAAPHMGGAPHIGGVHVGGAPHVGGGARHH